MNAKQLTVALAVIAVIVAAFAIIPSDDVDAAGADISAQQTESGFDIYVPDDRIGETAQVAITDPSGTVADSSMTIAQTQYGAMGSVAYQLPADVGSGATYRIEVTYGDGTVAECNMIGVNLLEDFTAKYAGYNGSGDVTVVSGDLVQEGTELTVSDSDRDYYVTVAAGMSTIGDVQKSLAAEIIGLINTYVWYIAFVFLVGLGIYFMIRLKGLPILRIHRTSKLALSGVKEGEHKHTVSSFEAFCIGLGARVGVGNIAGVASAIIVGGPGAVFWMWIFAIIGSASSFMESTLSQLFKEKKSDGQYHSGPAYYAQKGLGSRKLAVLLAILIVITFGIGFVGVQATNSATALAGAFVFDHNKTIFGALIAIAAAIIIFGGMKRIAKFSTKIVPVMALFWFVFCIIVICCNIDGVIHAVEMIFSNAFGIQSVGGGALGAVMMMGLKRGVFSNEAGLGSIANIAGTADVKHPVKQGMIQSFGTIVDTLVVCSFTAFVILSFGSYGDITALNEAVNPTVPGADPIGNATLVQGIFQETFLGGTGPIIVSLFMLVFAFTSLIGYYTMSESNIRFIKDDKKFVFAVRVLIIAVAFLSCIISTGQMEQICDTFMAAMGAVNMIVVFLLSKFVFRAYKDWREQEDAGVEDPVFHRSVVQDLIDEKKANITEWE